ncbi:putative glutaredoxin [Lumpy skin disease virus]|uniref:Glutaredoxin-2 n=2 Tax=Capripoxvirus TaxID=10265 RepID=A0A5C0PSV9_9POXV|nr:glutaredoxin-like protein [Lumpy skin disease virus NI-2490]AAN02621.1 putative glutaredoxin [Lumpy skin disease virus NW-LW]AAN02778.1 putative glutaredoxin [Lumpy skin disease virus]QEJ79201.1 thioredoxin-like protein [Goatpox virus]AAK85014.1 LSDV053 putative glutaredoxin [Lumpy skin disease virus NI-2490]AOE47629.1 glutaredoxin-like protein [Lumpy skin disease virus]
MKKTLILFGKPLCGVCESISDAIKILEDEYDILRINILSFFSKNGQIKEFEIDEGVAFINNFFKYLSSEAASLFKYNPETGQMAYVNISKFFNLAVIDKSFIKKDKLKEEIENSPYGVWPPPSITE